MPILTNRERLTPGPAPNRPPWVELTTRELTDWLHVSLQACYIWETRRSGPPRHMRKNRRAAYRLGDVLHWLEGPASPTAQDRIKTYLGAHWRGIALASEAMPPPVQSMVRAALVRVPELTSAEIAQLSSALVRHRVLEVNY
jgi:hypothetical protein